MITGAEGRQTHTLLDLKKQQWAKEREEIARMDELISSSHHHQHATIASSHHHQIERTSIRTYYSNMDVSQMQMKNHQRNARQQQFRQQHQYQQPRQPYAPDLLARYPQHNPNPYAVPLPQSAMMHQQQQQQQHTLRHGNGYDYEHQRYIDVIDDGLDMAEDYEDNDMCTSYQRRGKAPPMRRASFMPRGPGRRNHTTSMMSQIPGQRQYTYDELAMPGAGLQTAKGRMQNAIPVLAQQPEMRIRSPSLPLIHHQDYTIYKQQQQQQQVAVSAKASQKMPPHTNQLSAAGGDGGGIPVGAPSNVAHRFNNQNNPGNPGCQEEDTSGYRSDSPKNAHTPEIWYNDGASMQGSSRTTNSGAGGADSNSVGVVPTGITSDSMGDGLNLNTDGDARCEKNAIAGQQLDKDRRVQKQSRSYVSDELQQQQQQRQDLNSTYNMPRSYNSGLEDSCHGSYYIAPPSPSNISTRDISTSNTYQVHPSDQTVFYPNSIGTQHFPDTDHERAKWSNYNNNNNTNNSLIQNEYTLKQSNGPNWLNRSQHELKDSEDDTQSMQSSYLRGQNAPVDPNIMAERIDKRRKATEYHNAIKQQLLEREMLRKWEMERSKQEEMLEEERLRRQNQVEQERLEWERRQQMKREEMQKKKHQTMLDAIAKAEEAAKQEKQRKRKQRVAIMERDQKREVEQTERELNEKVIEEVTKANEVKVKNCSKKTTYKRNESVNHSGEKAEIIKKPEVKSKTENQRKVAVVHSENVEESNKASKISERKTKENTDIPTQAMKIEKSNFNDRNRQNTKVKEVEGGEVADENQKVLIGSPINLRRNISKKTVTADGFNKDIKKPHILGLQENVAVIMQPATLIPLPVTSDISGLQNAIGNLQIATYWMQQQLKPSATASTMDLSTKATGDCTERTITSVSTEEGYQIESVVEEQEQSIEKACPDRKATDNAAKLEAAEDESKQKELALMPLKITPALTDQFLKNEQEHQDVETQTELPLNCDLCLFHENFYKVLLKRELSTTTTTTQTSNSKTKPDKEADKDQETTTTITTTTTTTFKAKAKDKDSDKYKDKDKEQEKDKDKERDRNKRNHKDGDGPNNASSIISIHNNHNNNKVDDRPKWGVNRPVVQYVKASERDPFYLRNKKKHSHINNHHQNGKAPRSQSLDARLDNGNAEAGDDETLRGADSACEDDDVSNAEEGFLLKTRNVCTEILPIKTDEKGRIFLNFREASAIMNEDEIKNKLRQRYFNFSRILPRRSWASATQQNLQFRAVAATAMAAEPTAHLADD
ncbi:calponin homology domain-containing protein DDB_G0272472 [Eurosta solidaginis]|uniref:calponin homology domain-containing protein DDB_G0272472 n=1 Tax=Eurosta solidaginis TaxID=178769 RepID=UPI003530FF75